MKKFKFLLILFVVTLTTSLMLAQPHFINTFDTDPVLSATQAPGVWYTDRYAPAGFAKSFFDGDNRLKHSISTADAYSNRPGGYQFTFYNTQGRKFDINNVGGTSISVDLYIAADWQTSHRRADIWATGFDATNTVSAYPIIGFANTTGSNPVFRAYESNGGNWYNIPKTIIYGSWYNLKIELTTGGVINYYLNGEFVWSFTPDPPATTYLGNMMLQAYNFGDPTLTGGQYALESYDVYWDNAGAVDYDLYLAQSPTVLNGLIFPNDLWPKPWGDDPLNDPGNGYPGDLGVDWGFKSALSFFIVPEAGSQFSACDIVVEWDNTMYSYLGLENTGIFNTSPLAFFTQQLGTTTRLYIQASILPGPSTPNFFTITSGQYIAKLNFNSLKVGYGGLSFASIDFRKFDGVGGFQPVYFLENNAKVKNYLGDVATPTLLSTGDGKVDVHDLNAWTQSYWSGVAGYTPGLLYYKAKYDIGPTSTTTVYGMPTTDYKIQFEDLVIFAMSYGLSGNNLYPKVAPVPTEPVEVTVGKPIATGNETLVPIFISGAVQDLRAASLSFSGSFGKLISAEKGDLLNSYTTPVMLMSRANGNNVFVDLSIVGADVNGLSEEGQLFVLRFEGKANVNVTTAELRNLANSPMLVKLNGNYKGIPTEFGLSQNYPNPFNPSTMISYQVPVAAMVQIAVFNSIGEKVGMLVNEVKEPGYYEVTWNASAMPSGVYFFRINASEFTAVKKMMLTK